LANRQWRRWVKRYFEAITVIQQIADNLTGQPLRETFLASNALQAIMLQAMDE
jgi:hypothetical protein